MGDGLSEGSVAQAVTKCAAKTKSRKTLTEEDLAGKFYIMGGNRESENKIDRDYNLLERGASL